MRYNSPNTPLDWLSDFVRRGGVPVTLALVGMNVLTFLATFFSPGLVGTFLQTELVFGIRSVLHAPWTLLTYALVSLPPFSLWFVINLVFFWLSGGSLERSWGSQRFAVFFFALTLASSLSLLIGSLLLHGPLPLLYGVFLPWTGLIVAFCMLNPEQQITVYFFPVRAKYLAIGVTAWTYLSYGSMMGPLLGLFSLGGVLAAFLYVRFARPWGDIGSYSTPRRSFSGPDLRMDSRPERPTFRTSSRTTLDGSPQRRSPFDFAGRWKDRQDRRRLEKLWKNSGLPGSEPEWRDDEKRRR